MNYIKNYSITFNASSLEFQSTPSVGRATPDLSAIALPSSDISIHALRGEGDRYAQPLKTICPVISIHALRGEGDIDTVLISVHFIVISIHALRGEGDSNHLGIIISERIFQSTPSVGRATKGTGLRKPPPLISIHALRGEGDHLQLSRLPANRHFNPRPPWGGRLQKYTNMQCYACT